MLLELVCVTLFINCLHKQEFHQVYQSTT